MEVSGDLDRQREGALISSNATGHTIDEVHASTAEVLKGGQQRSGSSGTGKTQQRAKPALSQPRLAAPARGSLAIALATLRLQHTHTHKKNIHGQSLSGLSGLMRGEEATQPAPPVGKT
jgi:hypothetical protein